MKKFIFRNQECYYDYEWNSDDEFLFQFSPTLDSDFIDEEGDTYFMICYYDRENEDNDMCSPWRFFRWYEYESVDACDYFKDKLTEEECAEIKKFMKMLMKI